MNTDFAQLITEGTINQLSGKQVLFKLTDEDNDEGLIGILKQFNGELIIERDGVEIVIEVYELYFIEEYKGKI